MLIIKYPEPYPAPIQLPKKIIRESTIIITTGRLSQQNLMDKEAKFLGKFKLSKGKLILYCYMNVN